LNDLDYLFIVETDQERTERKVADPKQISVLDSKYSVQALSLLAEVSNYTQGQNLDLYLIP
jgi:hypothetical protein